MSVTLRDVTEDNFEECIKLKVRKDQPFVASNLYSIAEAKVCPYWIIKAVYADEAMVGFVMYLVDPKESELYLCRFMIDERHQGKGYGKATLDLIEGIARATPGVKRLELSTGPDNANGIRIYTKFGFVDTGRMEDGEEVFVKELS